MNEEEEEHRRKRNKNGQGKRKHTEHRIMAGYTAPQSRTVGQEQ